MVATNPMVLEHPADGLFRIAFADNRICAAEDAYLRRSRAILALKSPTTRAFARTPSSRIKPVAATLCDPRRGR